MASTMPWMKSLYAGDCRCSITLDLDVHRFSMLSNIHQYCSECYYLNPHAFSVSYWVGYPVVRFFAARTFSDQRLPDLG